MTKRPRHQIRVEWNTNTQDHRKDNEYSFLASKNFGDCHGVGSWAQDKTSLLARLRTLIKSWEGFDSILGRVSDPVTAKNLTLVDETGTITVEELLHNTPQLSAFFSGGAI